jgi:gluconate 2-dehydrogenase gamma chain
VEKDRNSRKRSQLEKGATMQPPSAGENPVSRRLPSRRDALKAVSVVVGGALTGAGGGILWCQAVDAVTTWHFFTPDEARLVEALSEQIIPADKDPGAKDAGVVFFIDRQLVGPYKRWQTAYRTGLRALQETCRKQFGKPFEALAWNDQTKVLASLEAGRAPNEIWKSPTCGEFFNLVLEHTMQGFYGSPTHGGNRDYASFKMLGLEYPRM